MIERISLRLDLWKFTLLPKGGRLTLIESTLVTISNYLIYFHNSNVGGVGIYECILTQYLK